MEKTNVKYDELKKMIVAISQNGTVINGIVVDIFANAIVFPLGSSDDNLSFDDCEIYLKDFLSTEAGPVCSHLQDIKEERAIVLCNCDLSSTNVENYNEILILFDDEFIYSETNFANIEQYYINAAKYRSNNYVWFFFKELENVEHARSMEIWNYPLEDESRQLCCSLCKK